jgi:hypothetical protein
MAHHPQQPIERDAQGVPRFKANKIIDWLFETGKLDLNEVAVQGFPAEDRMQLAQLLGYSVGGYANLSYASAESVLAADKAVEALDKEPPNWTLTHKSGRTWSGKNLARTAANAVQEIVTPEEQQQVNILTQIARELSDLERRGGASEDNS